MDYKKLGKSNLNISRIGFGTMSLKPDQPDFSRMIDTAIDQGINYFDTADLYDKGENEALLGKVFKGKRSKVIIATKVGNQWREDGSGWDWNPRKDYILKCADESLRRLQTDYLDLYQLHGGTMEDNIEESIEAFEILIQQGKILNYGLSSIRPNVIREHIKHGNMVSVMTQYSLLDKRPEESTLDLLFENNIGVVTRGSVASGLLINKTAKEYLGYSESEVKNVKDLLDRMSDEHKKASHIAIQYVLNHPAVTSAIIGIRTPEQLEDAIKAVNLPPLSEEEMNLLHKSVAAKLYTEHR
ncbi:MAG: aldo/keto reductase [Ginsengibacter sp.]